MSTPTYQTPGPFGSGLFGTWTMTDVGNYFSFLFGYGLTNGLATMLNMRTSIMKNMFGAINWGPTMSIATIVTVILLGAGLIIGLGYLGMST